MRIYIAGPYSAPTPEGRQANTDLAMEIAVQLIQKGHVVFVPHLSHYLDGHANQMGKAIDYAEWMRQDEAWLRQSEALYLIAPSPGANQEHRIAVDEMKIPIFHSMDDVPDA